MMDILKFGDIFRFKEQEYVFLHLTSEFIFAARIFDVRFTEQVKAQYEKRLSTGQLRGNIKDHAIYSFVVLKTDEFKDRMASFAKTQEDNTIVVPDIIGRVSDEDLAEIKKEIVSDSCPVAIVVKEYIKSL